MKVGKHMVKDISALLAKRRTKWYSQNIRYLRYVFNDHFILVLMFLLGFLAYQYAAFLKHLPQNWLPGYLIAAGVSILILFVGQLATFIEPADQQFLLAKEEAVQAYLQSSIKRSMLLPTVVIVLSITLLAPLIGLSFPLVLVWIVVLLLIKYSLLVRKARSFIRDGLIQWQYLINHEKKRQYAVLKIFSQFTEVKGLQQTAKRRKYLDVFLGKSKEAYTYLFIRTFLRSGDYFMLMLRLTGLAVLSLILLDHDLFALLLTLVFTYLLVFQLLPISQSQDYQIMTRLYPIHVADKKLAANKVISNLVLMVSGLELVVSLVTFQDKKLALVFILSGILLGRIYPALKLKSK